MWINVTAATVSWTQIEGSLADEETLLYLVTYSNTKTGTSKTKNVSSTASNTTITGLDSAEGYVFSVAAAVLVNGSIIQGPAAQPTSSVSRDTVLLVGVIAGVCAVLLLPTASALCCLIM